jgi:hypothetical protein
LVLLDRGFSSGELFVKSMLVFRVRSWVACLPGVTTWEFRLDHDSNGGECTCFGAATKPITEFSYTSSSAYMYRCYNGQLYGKGKASENKSKVDRSFSGTFCLVGHCRVLLVPRSTRMTRSALSTMRMRARWLCLSTACRRAFAFRIWVARSYIQPSDFTPVIAPRASCPSL